MGLANALEAPVNSVCNLLNRLQSPLLLAFRFYVAWVFFSSGLWKLNNWEQNLAVFEYEYAVPLLH